MVSAKSEVLISQLIYTMKIAMKFQWLHPQCPGRGTQWNYTVNTVKCRGLGVYRKSKMANITGSRFEFMQYLSLYKI